MAGEFDYIGWIRQQTRNHPRVVLGPGDDCAVVKTDAALQLITTDMLMDGVDFIVGVADPVLIGRKAMAVNLSDIAAMAGKPTSAVVSVALPQGPGTRELAEKLFQGMSTIANEFDCPIIGGDTNSWNGPLVISVTVTGEPTGKGPVTRSGAKPGDWLFVTGPCGGSIRGHHFTFTPRIREAQQLHSLVRLNAMIDISDGLAADLNHICEESRCGAAFDAAAIPVNDGVTLANALGDGEDFELIFAVSPADGDRLTKHSPVPVWKIGECVDNGLWIIENGMKRELKPTGWSHTV
ncbi:thiamine-phosphate kinase [soil metagenome]